MRSIRSCFASCVLACAGAAAPTAFAIPVTLDDPSDSVLVNFQFSPALLVTELTVEVEALVLVDPATISLEVFTELDGLGTALSPFELSFFISGDVGFTLNLSASGVVDGVFSIAFAAPQGAYTLESAVARVGTRSAIGVVSGAVPQPGTLALLTAGLLAAGLARRRRAGMQRSAAAAYPS